MVKGYLSRKGIGYTERNVSIEREALEDLLKIGYRSTPITLIGDEKLVGYDLAKLEAALGSAPP